MPRKLPFLTVVAAALAFVSGCGGDAAPKTKPPVAAPSSGSSQAGNGSCRPTDTSQRVPTVAPAGVSWQLFKGVAVPSSATAGPLVIDGDIARCYAHTPQGALVASVQLSVRLDLTSNWRQLLQEQVADGPGKPVYLRERVKDPTARSVAPGEAAQLAGFRFVTYSPQVAVIQTIVRNPATGHYASSTSTVKWDGDWKLELQPNGNTNTEPEVVSSPDGYIRWAGV